MKTLILSGEQFSLCRLGQLIRVNYWMGGRVILGKRNSKYLEEQCLSNKLWSTECKEEKDRDVMEK